MNSGRGRSGQADRAASLDRDRAAKILGPGAHVWRRSRLAECLDISEIAGAA